jgi:anion transporter
VQIIPIGLEANAHMTLSVIAFVVCLWVFEIMPIGVAALFIPVLLIVLLGEKAMPAKTAFAGFTNSTLWLMIGAFLLGEAMVSSNAAKRVAYNIMKLGGSSYTRIIILFWIAGTVLGALVPSGTVRVAIFIPIMIGIVAAYEAPASSRFSCNLLLHVYWSSIAGSTLWYTGTNMNPTAMGIAEGITGYLPGYFTWFAWMLLPTIVLAVGCFIIAQLVMKPEKEILSNLASVDVIKQELNALGRISGAEIRAIVFFLLAVVLWVTESLHGISTAWVAILVAMLLFVPKIGVLNPKSIAKVSWDTILLLGVALGFGSIIGAVGLDVWLTENLLTPVLTPFAGMGMLGFAFGIALIVGLFHFLMASASAETAMLTPLIANFANSIGGNVTVVSNIVARAAQNIFVFPYQTLPLVVLWGTGFMDMKKCLKSMGAIAVFNLAWASLLGPYLEFMMTIIS